MKGRFQTRGHLHVGATIKVDQWISIIQSRPHNYDCGNEEVKNLKYAILETQILIAFFNHIKVMTKVSRSNEKQRFNLNFLTTRSAAFT